jgi:prevent-host-death family protein
LFGRTLPANLFTMVTLNQIHPLADFQKNAKGHLRRLNKTGQPEVLTVNGKPAVVVQDARSYQRLLDSVEQAEAIAGIKLGLESLGRDEGVPAKRAFARLRRKHKIFAGE